VWSFGDGEEALFFLKEISRDNFKIIFSEWLKLNHSQRGWPQKIGETEEIFFVSFETLLT